MRWRHLPGHLLRLAFIVYCFEAGLFLLVAPWKEIWPTLIAGVPGAPLRRFLYMIPVRGAVSGFGLVHLVWAVHDLFRFLQKPKPRRTVADAAPVRASDEPPADPPSSRRHESLS